MILNEVKCKCESCGSPHAKKATIKDSEGVYYEVCCFSCGAYGTDEPREESSDG